MGLTQRPLLHYLIILLQLTTPIWSNTSSKSILDLINDSKQKTPFERVCQTLILGYTGDTFFPELHSALEEPQVLVKLSVEDIVETTENQSYFFKELQAEDIMFPSQFQSFRFIPQCSVLVLEGTVSKEFDFMLELILDRKLAKSNRDYFVFFSEKKVLEDFFASHVSLNIAYKFGVYDPRENSKEEQLVVQLPPEFSVMNLCDEKNSRDSKELVLYNRDCKVSVKGTTVRVAAVAGDQFGSFENNPDGSLKKARGIYFLMLEDCSKRMNFTIRMYRTGGSGSKKNGVWNGGLGELRSYRAQISFPISIIEPRSPVIDYSPLLAWFEKVFWVKAPPLRTTAKAVLKPFTVSTWLAMLVSTLGCLLIFFFFIQNNFKESHKEPLSKSKTLATVLDLIIRILLEQSTSLRGCVGSRIRFTIGVWAAFCLIVGTGYRSKLFFFLTFLESDIVPRTHHELAYSDYELYFRTYGGVAYRYMIQSKDPVHKAMVRDGRLTLESTTVDCIKRVFTEENAACMDYGFSGDYTIFTNATLFAEADPKASKLFKRSVDVDGKFIIIWAFRKYSPLTVVFNPVVSWIIASGMYDRWVYDDWNRGKIQGIRYLKSEQSVMRTKLEEIEKDLSGGPKPLTWQSLTVPFVFLLLFHCVGVGLLVFEEFRSNSRRIYLKYIKNFVGVKSVVIIVGFVARAKGGLTAKQV